MVPHTIPFETCHALRSPHPDSVRPHTLCSVQAFQEQDVLMQGELSRRTEVEVRRREEAERKKREDAERARCGDRAGALLLCLFRVLAYGVEGEKGGMVWWAWICLSLAPTLRRRRYPAASAASAAGVLLLYCCCVESRIMLLL